MTKTIDYTKDNRQPICPECGRRGKETRYDDGTVLFTHTLVQHDNPYPHAVITDSCYIKSTKSEG